MPNSLFVFLILTQGYVDFKRERKGIGERFYTYINMERDINWLLPLSVPTREGNYNLGMCPNQEECNLLAYEKTL